jgi:uncharacterized protein with HEPN domain
MKPETAKRLHDAYAAATELQQFIEGHTAASFDRDRGLQLSVHKLLEIMGKVLSGARRVEPEIVERIPDLQRYVSVRNRITHGYDSVDYGVLWAIAHGRVSALVTTLGKLLAEAPPPETEA